jgi:fucose 4-O-acetylase-like acetyltransferase
MHSPDRLHALDAVRAFALLLGIALHAAQPFLDGLSGWVTKEAPSDALATLWFTILMFRMPLFFLIAGFFGRMVLERRGPAGCIRARSQRVAVVRRRTSDSR